MTKQQIAWASRHDWFIEGFDGAVLVREDETGRERTFDNIKSLRAWAGY